LCPNCLIGIGERIDDRDVDELLAVAERGRGSDPVHPDAPIYALMAEGITE
jgi:hypothetical protein